MWSLLARITGDHERAELERIVARVDEIRQVAEHDRFPWMAGQLDEIHTELTASITRLSSEINDVKSRLTAVLIAIVTAAITIPLSIVWAAAQAANT